MKISELEKRIEEVIRKMTDKERAIVDLQKPKPKMKEIFSSFMSKMKKEDSVNEPLSFNQQLVEEFIDDCRKKLAKEYDVKDAKSCIY